MRLDVGQFCARLLAIGFVLVCVRSAGAADLSFTGIDRDSDLYSTLRGGSLLVEQTDQDVSPSPQELVAAAQADYARLLAVLWTRGGKYAHAPRPARACKNRLRTSGALVCKLGAAKDSVIGMMLTTALAALTKCVGYLPMLWFSGPCPLPPAPP